MDYASQGTKIAKNNKGLTVGGLKPSNNCMMARKSTPQYK